MLNVGLTGGIGAGKSEVTKRFAALGATVIDADAIAREVVEPGTPGLAAVVAEFGEGMLAADGSLDLYLQNESPGTAREANWLPAPKGKFVLMMRMYWPKEKDPSIIDGSWKPPVVKVAAK